MKRMQIRAQRTADEGDLLARLYMRCTDSEGGCREWTGCFKNGHPAFSTKAFGCEYLVRRLVWRLHEGSFPAKSERMFMVCRNSRCVAPHHLAAVSPAELQRIASAEGAYATPQRRMAIAMAMRASPAAMLTDEQAQAARQVERGQGKALAKEFGVSQSLISRVRLGRARQELLPGASIFSNGAAILCAGTGDERQPGVLDRC